MLRTLLTYVSHSADNGLYAHMRKVDGVTSCLRVFTSTNLVRFEIAKYFGTDMKTEPDNNINSKNKSNDNNNHKH